MTTYAAEGRCVKKYSSIANVVYQLNVRFKPIDTLTLLKAYVPAEEIVHWFNIFLQTSVGDIDKYDICITQIIIVTSDITSKQDHILRDFVNSTLIYFDVFLEITINQFHDSDEFVNKMLSVNQQYVEFNLNNTNVPFTQENDFNITARNITFVAYIRDTVNNSYIFDIDTGFNVSIFYKEELYPVEFYSKLNERKQLQWFYHLKLKDALQDILDCNIKFLVEMKVKLLTMRKCPMVTITNQNELRWYDIVEGIIFMKTHYFLESSEYIYFNESGQIILVCVGTFNKVIEKLSIKVFIDGFSGESIVSIACLSVSIIGLILTLITYCMFEQLRTLPGKNNMSLSINLMLAQIFFLIGSLSQFEPFSISCKIIGIVIHFLWLQSVIWMNICTYHIFTVLIKTKVLRHDNDRATLVKYHTMSIIASAVIVSVNIIYSLVTSKYKDFGYGKTVCYISTELMQEITFGIPVALVIVTNITLFSIVVVKLMRMPDISSAVKHERNNAVIFARLSTLTGLTWVFGFVYSWTGIQAFSYIFTVMSGGQGVLIMISFIVNKRVFDLYTKRFCKQTLPANSNTCSTPL